MDRLTVMSRDDRTMLLRSIAHASYVSGQWTVAIGQLQMAMKSAKSQVDRMLAWAAGAQFAIMLERVVRWLRMRVATGRIHVHTHKHGCTHAQRIYPRTQTRTRAQCATHLHALA